MRRSAALVVVALCLVLAAACSSGSRAAAPSTTTSSSSMPASPAVPVAHAALAAELRGQLDALAADPRLAGHTGAAPVVGAELLAANGNRGPALLASSTLAVTKLELDRLHELGVGGVTVAVKFPLFEPSFPHAADYRAFFRSVAAEVRARHMTLDVELGAIFSGTPFSPISYDYRGFTLDRLANSLGSMAQVVVDDLHPDWLTLVSEPDTDATLTGVRDLGTPEGETALITRVLTGLRRGTTKVGAGTGTWLPPTFASDLVATSIDYLDLHVYPTRPAFTDNALAMAKAAHEHGKDVVLDEAWLYKTSVSENLGGVAASVTVFARDAAPYWEPLDVTFVRALHRMAWNLGVRYESYFWSGYLFAYAPAGTDVDALPYRQVAAAANAAQYAAMQRGSVTATGEAVRQLPRR